MKKCSKCQESKSFEEFELRPDAKDGRRSYCRACKAKRHSERKSERLNTDELLFWKIRASYLNTGSGRRNGKAAEIISNSPLITHKEVKELFESQGNSCLYCKQVLAREQIVFDHKYPLSRDGQHNIANLAVCCAECNRLKHTRTEEEFITFLHSYLRRFPGIPR